MKGTKVCLHCQPCILVNAAFPWSPVPPRMLSGSCYITLTCPVPAPTEALSWCTPFGNHRVTTSTWRHLKAVQQRRCPRSKFPWTSVWGPIQGAPHPAVCRTQGRGSPCDQLQHRVEVARTGSPRLLWKHVWGYFSCFFAHNRNSSRQGPQQHLGRGGVCMASLPLAYVGHLWPHINMGDFTSPCLGQSLYT